MTSSKVDLVDLEYERDILREQRTYLETRNKLQKEIKEERKRIFNAKYGWIFNLFSTQNLAPSRMPKKRATKKRIGRQASTPSIW